MWHWHKHQCHYITKNIMLHIFQSSWPNKYNGAIGITWCSCQFQVSNDWNSHVASYFDHPKLANAMVLLMLPLVSCCTLFQSSWPNKMVLLAMPSPLCHACTGVNRITWTKGWCYTLFQALHLMKKMAPLMMQLASQDSNSSINGITWLKNECRYCLDMLRYKKMCLVIL